MTSIILRHFHMCLALCTSIFALSNVWQSLLVPLSTHWACAICVSAALAHIT